jgi:peptide deformylase
MELVKPNDPILTTRCMEYQFEDPPFDPIGFAKDLVKFMRDNDGLGLAANQVGVPYRVFAMRADPNKVCYNPRIVWESEESILLDEGCLTYPGLYVKIKRPRHCKIRYTQPNGDTITETFTGQTARVCFHEVDHLDGVLFYNKASMYHRETALKKWRKKNGK